MLTQDSGSVISYDVLCSAGCGTYLATGRSSAYTDQERSVSWPLHVHQCPGGSHDSG